jgi:hypothetical protein
MIPEFLGLSQVTWQAIAALTTVAALVVAAVAAVVAYNQFRANQKTRDDQSRPYVIADFEPSPTGIVLSDFVVRNIGTTPARDVTVRLDPEPRRAREETAYPLTDARLLSGELPMLAPGRELRVFFDSMPERYAAKLPMSFKVRIQYRNSKGKLFDETSTVDMDSGRGSLQATVYGIHDAAKSLKEIEKAIGALVHSLRGPIEVTTERRDEYETRLEVEESEMLRRHEEQREALRRSRAQD